MHIIEDSYQERPVVIINILDQQVEILKPENVVLRLTNNNRAAVKHFDVGSLCFNLRRSRPAGRRHDELKSITEVVLSSKEEWRVKIINSFIEHVRTEVITKSESTIINIIKIFFNFFSFCEKYSDFKDRAQTFEGFLSIYRDFTDNLKHRIRLAPNNQLFVNRATASSAQRLTRRFLLHLFNKAEIELIRYVPSIIRGRDKSSIVSARESTNRDAFIKFSFSLFNCLADGIINQDYAPVKLILPVSGKSVTHIYLDPTYLPYIVINPDLTWPSLSTHEGKKMINDKWPEADQSQRHQLHNLTRQAKKNRSFITPSHCLSKTYLLAQSAFIACFYAATGINPTPLINLKVTSEVPKTLRGMRFSGLKARAHNSTVYPEFGAHFLPTFNKFRKLREYVTNYFGDEPFWFFRPLGTHRMLDADSTLLYLREFIKIQNFNVPILNPTQIRKGLAIDFLRLSRGDIVITSKKLGNNITTVASNYTANAPIEQSREFSNFYQKMFQSAIKRARSIEGKIGVLSVGVNDFQTPSGHCSNTQKKTPLRIMEFSELAPKPECNRPETCLFCEHYSIAPDKEDIGKLLGLKELIKLIKINSGSSDQYINFFAPVFHRIDEIIEYIRHINPQIESIIIETQEEINRGSIHPFWDEQYEFLMDMSSQP